MKSYSTAPRPLVVLLGLTIVVEFVQVLLFAPSQAALLFPALVTVLSLSALNGSRLAILTIKYFFYFLCVGLLLSLGASRAMPALLVSRRVASAVQYFVVARYIGVSLEVSNFYSIKPCGHSLKEVNPIEKFKQQKKNRIVATVMALIFMVSSMLIKYNKAVMMSLPINPQLIALILQAIGLAFLAIAYIYAKCPICSKYAGNGWSITTCKNCGERLS